MIPFRFESKFGAMIKHVVTPDATVEGHFSVRTFFQAGDYVEAPHWAKELYPIVPGGKQHIYVKVLDEFGNPMAAKVRFYNEDGTQGETLPFDPTNPDGWLNYPIWQGYNPETSRGAWYAEIAGGFSDRVINIGLPNGWHVSSFIVFQWLPGVELPELPEFPELPELPEIPVEPVDPTQEPDPDNVYLPQIARHTARTTARVLEQMAFHQIQMDRDAASEIPILAERSQLLLEKLKHLAQAQPEAVVPKQIRDEAHSLTGQWLAFIVRYL